MKQAEEGLTAALAEIPITMTDVRVAMNATGTCVETESQVRSLLKRQLTSSVLWHQCVRTCEAQDVTCFLEIGCGKTLTGLNKRIGVAVPTIAVDSTDDLRSVEAFLARGTND